MIPPHDKNGEVKREEPKDESLDLIDQVDIVRKSKNPVAVNVAFGKIVAHLDSRIKKIASQYRIPGFTFDDKYQECLYALRFKAIKAYDKERGGVAGFALRCIRGHLATALKTSHQNKIRPINDAQSFDQPISDGDELRLIDIYPGNSPKEDVLWEVQKREHFHILMSKLMKKLSPMEKQVLRLFLVLVLVSMMML